MRSLSKKALIVRIILLIAIAILGAFLLTDGFKKPVKITKQGIKDNATRVYLVSKQLYLTLTKQRCAKPVKYSVGTLDEKFNLSKEELLEILEKSEKIWEEEYHKNLFEYSPEAKFKINLIYDERQKINQERKILDKYTEEIEEKNKKMQEEYEKLEKEHKKLTDYIFDAWGKLIDDEEDYGQRVISFNFSWDQEKKTKKKLDKERKELIARRAKLKQQADYADSLVNKMNKIAEESKKMEEKYNSKIEEFNKKYTANQEGRKFEEGEYSRDLEAEKIDIYSFWDKDELAMILAHEFGHALGIEHTDNPKSLMYYLNDQQDKKNLKLTNQDKEAIEGVCDF